MPNHLTRGLPNDYREANGYSTEAIIRMTFREKRATETLPNAESRDAEICICNVQSGFLRAEARSYHGEYDYLQCEAYMLDTDQ
jgi:hypothetical protein